MDMGCLYDNSTSCDQCTIMLHENNLDENLHIFYERIKIKVSK